MPIIRNESSTLLKISDINDSTKEMTSNHMMMHDSIRTLAPDASSKVLVKKREVTSPRKLREEAAQQKK